MNTMRPAGLAILLASLFLGACSTLAPPGESPQPPAELPVAEAPQATAPAEAASAADAGASTAPPPVQAAAPSPDALPETAQTAPAEAPTPVDPLRPDEPVEPDDEEARADLWQRVREGFSIPDLDSPLVRDREQYYASRPDYVARMTERSNRYLFHIVQEVHKRQLPTELALLPFIESAFNPQALSSAKASGIWQFMPATGRHYELRQNVFRDDRRDVLASTRAALDYLSTLHRMFGDWHLALAAYNWGEGNVRRAIARNRAAGLGTGYEDLRMPAETRLYVPKLQAVKNIVADPERFSIQLPRVENHPYFLSVPIERDIDVALAAELAGLDLAEFKALNPQMNRPVILAAGTPQVLLPYDNANRFVRELAEHRGPYASWTAWVAPKTMHPAEAARRVGMEEASLVEVNRIPPRMLVKAGSTLLVPRSRAVDDDVSSHVAQNAMMLLAPEAGSRQRRITLTVGAQGSSVAWVARRYKVPAADVARWNQVSPNASFRSGQRVVVYVAGPAAKSGSRRVASGKAIKRTAATSAKAAKAAKPATKAARAGKSTSVQRKTRPDGG